MAAQEKRTHPRTQGTWVQRAFLKEGQKQQKLRVLLSKPLASAQAIALRCSSTSFLPAHACERVHRFFYAAWRCIASVHCSGN